VFLTSDPENLLPDFRGIPVIAPQQKEELANLQRSSYLGLGAVLCRMDDRVMAIGKRCNMTPCIDSSSMKKRIHDVRRTQLINFLYGIW
jgi:hypothetical protein